MPNHCDQWVTFDGPARVIRTLHNAAEQGNLLQTVLPMPFEEHDNWYEWCNQNWGTKWDICDPVISETSWGKDPFWWHTDENHSFTFACWTAWAPPIPVWEKLVDMGLSVKARYEDEGGFFHGTYKDGVIDEVSEEFLAEVH